jgi:hypothetical protein
MALSLEPPMSMDIVMGWVEFEAAGRLAAVVEI